MIEKAKQLAERAHAGQLRRDGVTPYLEHVSAVAKSVSQYGEETEAAAWLHDVIEDSSITKEELLTLGFPESVVEAVVLLTFTIGTREEYYQRIKGNEIARRVKIADMSHNLSDTPTEKQRERYEKGLRILM